MQSNRIFKMTNRSLAQTLVRADERRPVGLRRDLRRRRRRRPRHRPHPRLRARGVRRARDARLHGREGGRQVRVYC